MQKFWKLQVCFVKKIPIVYLFELLRLIQFWQNFLIPFMCIGFPHLHIYDHMMIMSFIKILTFVIGSFSALSILTEYATESFKILLEIL